MPRRLFTAASVLSLVVSLLIVLSPRLTSAEHFWIAAPWGDLGPFDNADESLLFAFAILFAAPAVPRVSPDHFTRQDRGENDHFPKSGS